MNRKILRLLFLLLVASTTLVAIGLKGVTADDMWGEDWDKDGEKDHWFKDKDGDGNPDQALVDQDEDGKNEDFYTDEDKVVDAVLDRWYPETGNQPPILDPIGDQWIAEGELLTFTVFASDPDGDFLTYYTGPLPTNAAFISVTKEFFWMPNFDQEGMYDGITFYVTDGQDTDSTQITLTVMNTNRPPVIANSRPLVYNEGDSIVIQLFAPDPDGDQVDYQLGSLPLGATYDPATERIHWKPGFDQAGDYAIPLTATDENGAASYEDIVVIIGESPPGDLNCDGQVNILDIITAVNILLGIIEEPCTLPSAQDLNCDDVLNILDVVKLVNYILATTELIPRPYPVILHPQSGDIIGRSIFLEAVNLADRDGIHDSTLIEWSTDSVAWSPAEVVPYGASLTMQPPGPTPLSFMLLPDTTYEGPIFLRLTVVDTANGGCEGTSQQIPRVTRINDPIVDVQAHYDAATGILCWDARSSESSSLGGPLYYFWGTDAHESVLFGPVVQVPAEPGDSVAMQLRIEYISAPYIFDILDAFVEAVEEVLIHLKLFCECESLTMLPDAPGAANSVNIFDRIFWTIIREGTDQRDMVDRIFGIPWRVNLGGNPGPPALSYNFVVKGVMVGNPFLCNWGQRIRATWRAGAVANRQDASTPPAPPADQNTRFQNRNAMPAKWTPHPVEHGPNAAGAAGDWGYDDYRGPFIPAGAGFANSPYMAGPYPLPGWNRWEIAWYDTPGWAAAPAGRPLHYHITFKDYLCGFLWGDDCTQTFQVEMEIPVAGARVGPRMVPGSYNNPAVGADAGCP